ncbi:MAG TPA: hypothetical protein VIK90_05895, partial [Limnochordales bacterium]
MIVVAIVGTPAAGAAAAAPGVEVSLEHLVIAPAAQGTGALEVLDVVRLHPAAPGDGEGATFAVPLPQGYGALRVLAGLREGTVQAGPDRVEGVVDWGSGSDDEGGPSATVAVAYRVPLSALPHPWALSRPFPVEALFLLVRGDLEATVAGAQGAGPVELDGATYQGFVRQSLPAGEALLLALQPRAAGSAGSLPGWAWALVGAAGTAAGGAAAAWRRAARRRPPRRRLVESLLALDAEYEAGYLEEPRYRAERERLLRALAGQVEAPGRPGPAGPPVGGAG